jgi:transcriptional regulator with XRE-family HTH domain
MRTCNRHFPGTDRTTSNGYERDVAIDEKAMIDAISNLRERESASLEAIGYLMGADPAQLSRYLKGTRSTTLTNYIRIARALGYRSKLVLEKADVGEASSHVLSDLKIVPHQVRRITKSREK